MDGLLIAAPILAHQRCGASIARTSGTAHRVGGSHRAFASMMIGPFSVSATSQPSVRRSGKQRWPVFTSSMASDQKGNLNPSNAMPVSGCAKTSFMPDPHSWIFTAPRRIPSLGITIGDQIPGGSHREIVGNCRASKNLDHVEQYRYVTIWIQQRIDAHRLEASPSAKLGQPRIVEKALLDDDFRDFLKRRKD